MPAPHRLTFSLGGRPRARRRSVRFSAGVVLLTVLALGGAVAGVYTTGVTLGARIAPADDGDVAAGRPDRSGAGPAATDGGADDVAGTTTEVSIDGGATSLPDRAEGSGGGGAPTTPGSTGAGDAGTGGSATTEVDDPTAGRYPGLWPYSSWDEVRQHQGRDDGRFATAADTALGFAREVVGLPSPTVGAVDEGATEATVEVRTGAGSSLVSLARAGADGSVEGAPWSVTHARGTVSLDAPATAAGPSLPVTSDGNPGVVGVHDRQGWRGVGVAPQPGATIDLRLEPGAAGPAMAVALGGDPHEPSTFTVQRVDLGGGGAVALVAPADPVAATQALVESARRGDVGAVWELLTPDARASVRDWRGLAGRLPALRDRLALVAAGALTTTTVATGAGPVAVVAPAVATGSDAGGTIAALAFVGTDGARLASLDPGAVTWSGPVGVDRAVVAAGPSRPIALVVDGALWSAAPDGSTGLRAVADTLAPGAHLAIAVVDEGGRITASAFLFTVTDPLDAPEDPSEPPSTPAEPSTPTAPPTAGAVDRGAAPATTATGDTATTG